MKAAPLREHIWVTNSDVGVSMQGLLDHSVERILLDDLVVQKIKKLQKSGVLPPENPEQLVHCHASCRATSLLRLVL